MSEILFQITEEKLETGMRGFPVGYCTTSHIDPQKGLFYRERPIMDLSRWDPIEVIYLLYTGKKGSSQEIKEFSQDVQKRACCSSQVTNAIEQLPRAGHPMKLLGAALLLLGMHESSGEYAIDCLNVIAKMPHLVATVINHHAGWGKTSLPDPEKGYMESFAHLLRFPHKNLSEIIPIFKFFNIIHFDHGGGNLSTFVGKAVASGLEDLYGSLAAAMIALSGPRHGRANQDCLEFIRSILEEVGEHATAEDINRFIRQRIENQQLIFGFGHAVLREEDPRATLLYDYAKTHYPNHPLVKIALLLRQEGEKILKENPKIADPHANMDAISGVVLTAAGFAYPEYYTLLFGLARVVGISIQIVYERNFARGGKGTPIVRPKYLFKKTTDNYYVQD